MYMCRQWVHYCQHYCVDPAVYWIRHICELIHSFLSRTIHGWNLLPKVQQTNPDRELWTSGYMSAQILYQKFKILISSGCVA